MNGYRITVTYEFELDAPDYDMARQWALEEIERGRVIPDEVDVERLGREARKFEYPGITEDALAIVRADILAVMDRNPHNYHSLQTYRNLVRKERELVAAAYPGREGSDAA